MRLVYFDARGRVEPVRLLLEMAGVDYTYEATPIDVWMGPEGKPRMLARTPFGQLPILEDGPLSVCQSGAIHRHVARKFGFYGSTLEESARVDEVFETYQELFNDISGMHWNPKFHEIRGEHREATRKKLTNLDSYFRRTRADDVCWVTPGRYTLGDAGMAFILESILPLHPGLLEEFPALYSMMSAFFEAKGVREYVRGPRRARTFTISMAMFAGKPEETHQWSDG